MSKLSIKMMTIIGFGFMAQVSFASGQENFGPNQRIGTGVGTVTSPDYSDTRLQCQDGRSSEAVQAMKIAVKAAKKDCRRYGSTPMGQAQVIRLIAQDRQDGIPSFDCIAVATVDCR